METLEDLTKEQLIDDLIALRRRINELETIEKDTKKYEEELNRVRAMFEGLFEFAPATILVVNQEGRIIRVNKQTERLFGYSLSELLGTPLEILLPERFREIHKEHRRKFLAEPHVRPMGRELELYGRRKDSSEFHVDIALGPLQIEQIFRAGRRSRFHRIQKIRSGSPQGEEHLRCDHRQYAGHLLST